MTRYELLTFLHIASVIVWLGAGAMLALLVFGAERAKDMAREASYHRDVGWLAPRLFIPASLSSLVFGVLLVIDGPWGFDQLWVTVGMVGWLISFVLGFFYFSPEGKALGEIAMQRGPDDPELRRRIHKLNIVDRLQLAILFTIVADMVIKPTGDDSGVVIVGAAILAVLFAIGFSAIRRGAPAAPSATS